MVVENSNSQTEIGTALEAIRTSKPVCATRPVPRGDFYLGVNVVIEPLVDKWYAWSHLIPPATAARNISERHLRILDSFISAPEVHAASVKDPKLLGGPFMDIEPHQVHEVKVLRERTREKRRDLLELSA